MNESPNITDKNQQRLIGVIGGSTCSTEEYQLAEKTGELIARAGGIVVCGGMSGIMEAACKGASQAGGLTVGIIPSDNIAEANPYVHIPVATGMGIGRNIIIIRTAQALIAINGKYGTLSEIAFAMQYSKPVFVLQPFIQVPGTTAVPSPEEAVRLALQNRKDA